MLTYKDAFLAPIYFLLLLFWVIRWKNKHYKNSPLKRYIVPAFVIKSICCVLLAFLYEYYYGYSDSLNYFKGASNIWNATVQNPVYGLELIFKPFIECSDAAQSFGETIGNPIFADNIVSMFKISGFIGIFCFGTYIPIALVITLLSFIGTWKIFLVFVEEFPTHYKKIALTCLFAPSFLFWSTNIMKDPLCIYGLGICFSVLYSLLKGRFKLIMIVQVGIAIFLLLSLKGYIFYIFCVAGFCSFYIHILSKINVKHIIFIRLQIIIMFITIITAAVIYRDNITEILSSNLLGEVKVMQITQLDAGGSSYNITNIDDGSFFGIIRSYLLSLNVALFRPYLWEVPNIIALANALESFVIMIVSFYLLFKLKFFGFFKIALENRVLTFALIFTLLLAPLAGLVSFNFGTLVRYKTPVVPFYYTYLILIYYKIKEKEKFMVAK